MKKSIKNMVAAVLMVSVLAMGISVLVPSGTSFAIVDCTAAEIAAGTKTGCQGLTDGASNSNTAGGKEDLFGPNGVLTTVINFALYFIGAISVLMLIIGGVRYTISAGNEKAVGAAKSTILYAVIGVVVALLAYAIVNFVLGTFKAA